MATTATAPTNGRSAPVKFEPGFKPEQIALKAIPGTPCHSRYDGDQIRFSLTDGRLWYASLVTNQKIEQARIEPGEFFEVSKAERRGQGGQRLVTVDIKLLVVPEEPAGPTPQNMPAGRETATCHQSNGTTPRAPAPAPAATASNERRLPQLPQTPPTAGAPVNGKGETSADQLARCYRAAIDITSNAVLYAKAQGLVLAPCFEDARCAAATLFIAENDRRRF